MSSSSTLTQSWTFDSTTEVNICSGFNSDKPRACTVSNFVLFDEAFTALYPYGYVSMATGINFFNGIFFLIEKFS